MNTGKWITITNLETNRCLTVVEGQGGYYKFVTTPLTELELVRKRSVGKRIREFMKEENGKQEKTNR